MNLDPDLLRILNPGAKVYHTQTRKQGKVFSNNQIDIIVDYGKGLYTTYGLEEFEQLLKSDTVVANSRVTLGNGENFKIKPREVQPSNSEPGMIYMKDVHPPKPFIPAIELGPQPDLTNRQPAEIGYINFTTGKFSLDPKKGYTKVEYRKALEKVTLEVDSETVEKLKEMGLLK